MCLEIFLNNLTKMGRYSKQSQWNVGRSIMVANLFYFVYFAGKSCLLPVLTLYLREIGLSASQVGILMGSKAIAWFISAPFWLYIHKRKPKTRVMICCSLFVMIATNLAVTFFQPQTDSLLQNCKDQTYSASHHNGTWYSTIPPALESSSLHPLKSTINTSPTPAVTNTVQEEINKVTEKDLTGNKWSPTTAPTTTPTTTTTTTTKPLVKQSTTTIEQRKQDAEKTVGGIVADHELTTLAPVLVDTTLSPISSLLGVNNELVGKIVNEMTTHRDNAVDKFNDMLINGKPEEDESNVGKEFQGELKATSSATSTITTPPTTATSNPLEFVETTLDSSENEDLSNEKSKDLSQLSVYELGKIIYKQMQLNGYTSRDGKSIQRFIDEYPVTKHWKLWKKNRLRNLLISLLEKSDNQEVIRPQPSSSVESRRRRRRRSTHSRWTRDVTEEETNFNPDEAKKEHQDAKELSDDENVVIEDDEGSGGFFGNDTVKVIQTKIYELATDMRPFIESNYVTFLCILIMMVTGELISAPVELISDDAIYELLDELDCLARYGSHRISGLLGSSMAGITLSIIISQLPCLLNGSINRFNIHFYMFAALIGFAFMLAFCFPTYERSNNSARKFLSKPTGRCCWSCSPLVCSSCRHFLLVITIFVVGTTQAPVQNFILWEVQDLGGPSEIIYGSYISAQALTTLATMLCGKYLLKYVKPCAVAPISMLMITLQLILYSFMLTPWTVVPLQLLNIVGQSFLWTVVTYQTSTVMSASMNSNDKSKRLNDVHVFARSSQQRSMRTTYLCVYQGLAFGIGSMISGLLYDAFGGNLFPVLIASAIAICVWALVFTCYQGCCLRQMTTRKFSHLLSDTEEADDGYVSNNHRKNNAKKSSYKVHLKKQRERKKQERRRLTMDDSSSEEEELFGNDWLSSAMRKDKSML